MGVGEFEIDIGAEIVTGDGDGEVQEGEGGIGDGPGEFKVVVKCKVDELFKLLMKARGNTDTVINVAGEEVRDGASVTAEERLFHISYEEAAIAWTHMSAHSH
eukprot:g25782.t1